MNIFHVDEDPVIAAQALCDKHVVKMVLETAQIICTVLRSYGIETPYRSTHRNHPCTLWAASTSSNFVWTIDHGIALADEYTFRYGKHHKSAPIIHSARAHVDVMPAGTLTVQPQCMPDNLRTADVVVAYRQYYRHKESVMSMKWTARPQPAWFRALNCTV